MRFDEEHTSDGVFDANDDDAPAWKAVARKLYRSPAVFVAAFVVGFGLTFGPGALIVLRTPNVEELISQKKYQAAIDELERRKNADTMKATDWLLYGHVIHLQLGIQGTEQMLKMYAAAATLNKVDATALENTIGALGDAQRQARAIDVLAAWPSTKDVRVDADARLANRAADDNFFVRHGAVEALKRRKQNDGVVDEAIAACALADLRAKTCENNATHLGLTDELALMTRNAKKPVLDHDPYNALLDLSGIAASRAACVDPETVKAVMHAYASLSR